MAKFPAYQGFVTPTSCGQWTWTSYERFKLVCLCKLKRSHNMIIYKTCPKAFKLFGDVQSGSTHYEMSHLIYKSRRMFWFIHLLAWFFKMDPHQYSIFWFWMAFQPSRQSAMLNLSVYKPKSWMDHWSDQFSFFLTFFNIAICRCKCSYGCTGDNVESADRHSHRSFYHAPFLLLHRGH